MVAEVKKARTTDDCMEALMEQFCPEDATAVEREILQDILSTYLHEGGDLLVQLDRKALEFLVQENLINRVQVSHAKPKDWLMLKSIDTAIEKLPELTQGPKNAS